MKFLNMIWMILGISATMNGVFAQCDIPCIKKAWLAHDYTAVISKGSLLRDILGGRGIPVLDYMMVTSMCMQQPDKSNGCNLFRMLTEDYYQDVSNDDINLLKREYVSICTRNNPPGSSVLSQFHHDQSTDAVTNSTAGFYGHGKSYILMQDGINSYIKNPAKTMEGMERDFDQKTQVSVLYSEEQVRLFRSRQIKITDTKNNNIKISQLASHFSPTATYYVSPHFVCIANGKKSDLETCSRQLEKAYSYFIRYFDFNPPESYIVVYLASGYKQMDVAISRLYKDPVKYFVLGYSNVYDNSMLAWIPGWAKVGTFKHEMIHLLIKSEFSHLPVWFEEGLASLYEESRYSTGDPLFGINNWRLSLVREDLFKLSLTDIFFPHTFSRDSVLRLEVNAQTSRFYNLVDSQSKSSGASYWRAEIFEHNKTELSESAQLFFDSFLHANEDALMRYFILYLQEKNKLRPLYSAFLKTGRKTCSARVVIKPLPASSSIPADSKTSAISTMISEAG